MVQIRTDNLLRKKDVQRHFKVSERTVDNWFAKGLEKCRVGGLIYTSFEALERFTSHTIELVSDSGKSDSQAELEASF